jgi:hypothetical protein
MFVQWKLAGALYGICPDYKPFYSAILGVLFLRNAFEDFSSSTGGGISKDCRS